MIVRAASDTMLLVEWEQVIDPGVNQRVIDLAARLQARVGHAVALSTVCMTALQPSDKVRFKDASEAEQALREAWERCLTQGLVHPAVLAMDEGWAR